MTRLEWRTPRYNTGDGAVWNLHRLDEANMQWSILGTIMYLGLTRRANWADCMQRWRIDHMGVSHLTEIKVKSIEEAKATALAILLLTN